jgi:hypothetical protein
MSTSFAVESKTTLTATGGGRAKVAPTSSRIVVKENKAEKKKSERAGNDFIYTSYHRNRSRGLDQMFEATG